MHTSTATVAVLPQVEKTMPTCEIKPDGPRNRHVQGLGRRRPARQQDGVGDSHHPRSVGNHRVALAAGAIAAAEPRKSDADAARDAVRPQAPRAGRSGRLDAPLASRHRRPRREDPHLQLSARPHHRSPHQPQLRQHPRRSWTAISDEIVERAASPTNARGCWPAKPARSDPLGEALRRSSTPPARAFGTSRRRALLLAHAIGATARVDRGARCERALTPAGARGVSGRSASAAAPASRLRTSSAAAGFYGREFRVDDRVLVPRPETEHLIDAALAALPPVETDRASLDVGTGSGAIACTIAAETAATRRCGTDISRDGARDRATQCRAGWASAERCTFLHGDLAEPVRARRASTSSSRICRTFRPATIPAAPDPGCRSNRA